MHALIGSVMTGVQLSHYRAFVDTSDRGNSTA